MWRVASSPEMILTLTRNDGMPLKKLSGTDNVHGKRIKIGCVLDFNLYREVQWPSSWTGREAWGTLSVKNSKMGRLLQMIFHII